MREKGYDEDELCVICLAATDGIGPVSIRRLLGAARSAGRPLREVLRIPPAELEQRFAITEAVAALLPGIRTPAARGREVVQTLAQMGACPVFEGSEAYPARLSRFLGESAPPVLFVLGKAEALGGPCVAVVGSRTPSRAARAAARAFAAAQAAAGVTVVSGGARGIDTAAHRGAMDAGSTAAVPPVGIARFRWRGVRPGEDEQGRWCVVGQFPPEGGWRTGNALARNRTIVAASDAVVGFEPRDGGGTWHSCLTALRMRKPLLVVGARSDGSRRRGIERLVRLGACEIDLGNMPEADEFERLVREYHPPDGPAQLPLFEEPEEKEPVDEEGPLS